MKFVDGLKKYFSGEDVIWQETYGEVQINIIESRLIHT